MQSDLEYYRSQSGKVRFINDMLVGCLHPLHRLLDIWLESCGSGVAVRAVPAQTTLGMNLHSACEWDWPPYG
eukprot:1372139-Amphidinium_carterae.1